MQINTSKSLRLTKEQRSQIKVNHPLSEIIIGLLLGDGHIQKRNKNNSRFIYGQSSLRAHHLNYFYHIHELFKPYLSKDFKVKEKVFINKKTNNIYRSVSFTTLTLPCFTLYKEMFYLNNKKIVPLNIKEALSFRGLAYWIMDDGSLQNKGLHLSVYAFNYDEVLLLKSAIEDLFMPQYTIKCTIHHHKSGYRLYIWEESMRIVKKYIQPFMHKDMLYKITPK